MHRKAVTLGPLSFDPRMMPRLPPPGSSEKRGGYAGADRYQQADCAQELGAGEHKDATGPYLLHPFLFFPVERINLLVQPSTT